ncbi:hypothetical protein [Mesonia sp. K7]|uniref:hypothetical protein n=1 Tax=Mesonia sp. K7 TaxID=2218606 RepID=UPI000DA98A46|nr:hypothetical protein [Mesonia sp. K7]PZD78085.1 hypothetical protein DNG35_06860 [Mesonia sp. K7]
MKKLLFFYFLLIGFYTYGQVGIGTAMPDPSAQLDVTVAAGDKGVLLPRVALINTTDQTTITNGNVESLLVYNTATQNNVTPGYYYWYNGSWRRLTALGDHPETITTLVNNTDGSYTYTSEDGTMTTFTVGGMMVDNGDGTYTFTNPDGTNVTIQGVSQALTILSYDNNTGMISYIDENSTLTQLDMSLAIDSWETLTDLKLNPDNIHLDYTDEDGVTNQIDLTTLVQNLETLTTIVANADGTFTYTDENGNATQIDISNLETLTSLALNADGKTLEYTDESGTVTTVDLSSVITNFETITTLVDNGDGTYTYTNESGNTTVIDVNNTETLTELVLSTDNSTLTYTDENGNDTIINLKTVVQANQKTTTLADGVNTTVSSTVSGDNTAWQVNVATAKGANNTQNSTLGVVKEADSNPTVNIANDGSLSVNLENTNDIKEVSGNYTVLPNDTILLGNASTADVSIVMPNPVGKKGKTITIKKQDTNEDYYINVYGNINGLSQLYTALPYSGWQLTSDGTQWKITNKF